MKTIKYYILVFTALLLFGGCDKDFAEMNIDPYAVTDIDPALLFAGAQRTHLGTMQAEHTIVQQFVIPYNQGATLGFNFNEDIPLVNSDKWDNTYPTTLRNMIQALALLEEDTERVNLRSMLRIWKAQAFMGLVDAYGNVPYFDAGKAFLEGESKFYPKYDDASTIYDDLYNEIKSSVAALNPNADYVAADLFYGANSPNPSGSASVQVEKWKKLGNSLLLRLGMRYSKLNPSKAQSIVAEAFNGGVMTSNADNAYVRYDGTLYSNARLGLRDFSHFNYAAEPFVDQLKSTNDPRGRYLLANFTDPAAVANEPDPDTELANMFGVPIGVINNDLANPDGPYRGPRAGGLNYSQFNVFKFAAPQAPDFYATYAQTCLLLAEAALRGWVSGSAQEYYENGIRADLEIYQLYPGNNPIPNAEIIAYLSEPEVDFSLANTDAERLNLINTQYWIVNICNGNEAFANFRRSGYPVLSPNLFNNNLNGGFARRLTYPIRETNVNEQNLLAAAAAMGGNTIATRVFWDVP